MKLCRHSVMLTLLMLWHGARADPHRLKAKLASADKNSNSSESAAWTQEPLNTSKLTTASSFATHQVSDNGICGTGLFPTSFYPRKSFSQPFPNGVAHSRLSSSPGRVAWVGEQESFFGKFHFVNPTGSAVQYPAATYYLSKDSSLNPAEDERLARYRAGSANARTAFYTTVRGTVTWKDSTRYVLLQFDCASGDPETHVLGVISSNPTICSGEHGVYPESPRFDGTCHDIHHATTPAKGCVNSLQTRECPHAYPSDNHEGGLKTMYPNRPSPRYISNALSAQTASIPNLNDVRAHTIFMGQFLDHDITLVSEGNEQRGEQDDIEIPAGDPDFPGQSSMEFHRSRPAEIPSQTREFRNGITSWIDLSSVYGSTDERAKRLRLFQKGLMRHELNPQGLHMLPRLKDIEHVPMGSSPHTATNNPYAAGDVRANEHAVLLAFHTIWLRNHNRLADLFNVANPGATDEAAFQWARKVNILEWQSVIFHEWLPAIIGQRTRDQEIGEVQYEEGLAADLSLEFSSGVMRFGHTGIPDTVNFGPVGGPGGQREIETSSLFFQPEFLDNPHGDVTCSLMQGTMEQQAERIDLKVVDSLRNRLFIHGDRKLDLVSLNIQRERDHGIGSIDVLRESLGLPRYDNGVQDPFIALTQDDHLAQQIKDAYHGARFEEIDLFAAIHAEPEYQDGILGETSATSLAKTFKGLFNGDVYNFAEVPMDAPAPWRTPNGFTGFVKPLTHSDVSKANCPTTFTFS